MSLIYSCDVVCDRCGNWTHGLTGLKPIGLGMPSLAIAKGQGWSRASKSLYTDLCPDCLTETRKEEPK